MARDAKTSQDAKVAAQQAPPGAKPADDRLLTIPSTLTVRQLAELVGASPVEVIKALIKNGVMAAINQVIDYETAAIVARNMAFQTQEEAAAEETAERSLIEEEDASLLQRLVDLVGADGVAYPYASCDAADQIVGKLPIVDKVHNARWCVEQVVTRLNIRSAADILTNAIDVDGGNFDR